MLGLQLRLQWQLIRLEAGGMPTFLTASNQTEINSQHLSALHKKPTTKSYQQKSADSRCVPVRYSFRGLGQCGRFFCSTKIKMVTN